MKPLLLLVVSLSLVGCQNSKWGRKTSGGKTATALTSPETRREERLRSLRNETEARAKTYEKRGYTPAEAHAVAEAEYFRSGR
jgi:hypothetical protein